MKRLFVLVAAMLTYVCGFGGNSAAFNRQMADKLFPVGSFDSVTYAPFSFEYGGVHSSECLKSWKCSTTDRTLEDRILRTAVYSDPATGLEITAKVNIYTLSGGIDYTLYVKNCGSGNSPIISNLKALDYTFSSPSAVLNRLQGTKGYMRFNKEDFMPIEDALYLEGDKVEFGPMSAYSSSGAFPFYDITYPGGGFVTAIGWSGKWNSLVELHGGQVHTTAQMSELNTFLYPHEEIRSPRILLVFWEGGTRADGINQFRRTMINYVSPRYNGQLQRVPISHMTSSNHQDNSTTADNEKTYLNTIRQHNLGFEVYWLDAWWHKGGFPTGMGNYVYPIETPIDPERFPNGVKDVSDYAKAMGLKFLCWFAPEMITSTSLILKEHPEWIIPQGGQGGFFNLGNPDALAYMTKYMDDCIKAWGIDVWRTDSGYTMEQVRQQQDPDRVGILEIRQVEGIYKLWDALRENNPGLLIDNCCAGGSRIDLETSSRSISLWRTDNGVWANGWDYKDMAVLNQCNNVCLNQYIIQSSCACLGNAPYYIRSGFNNGLLFNDDNRPDNYDNSLVHDGINEVKRLRKYFYGDFYPLIFHSYAYDEWCAYQYNRPEEGDGVALVFRRDESPILTAELNLKGLDPNAKYEVDIYGESFKKLKTIKMKGSKLMAYPLTIKSRPGSALIEYRRL